MSGMHGIRQSIGRVLPSWLKARLWNGWYRYLILSKQFVHSITSATIEVSSVCNIRCEVCIIPRIPRKGLMKLEDFKIIVDKLPRTVRLIRMNYSGEPLLNKDIFTMIAYAKRSRPDMAIHVCTNGTLLHQFDPQEIFASGLDTIAIAIDGGSGTTHERYRAGSSFAAICENTRALCACKKRTGAAAPAIIMQSLVNAVNKDEVRAMEDLARDLGVDQLNLRYMGIPGIIYGVREFPEAVRATVDQGMIDGIIDRYLRGLPDEFAIYKKDAHGAYRIKKEMKKCFSFLSPLIYFNGDMSVCCHDSMGEAVFGNLLRESFAQAVARMPADKVYRKALRICDNCVISYHGINYREIPIAAATTVSS